MMSVPSSSSTPIGTGRLVVAPNLPAYRLDDRRVVLTEKFTEGMRVYASMWGGPVSAVMKPAAEQSDNLDNRPYVVDDLPFDVKVVPFGTGAFYRQLSEAAVVLGGPDIGDPELTRKCREMRVPCVNNVEYNLNTRLQIIEANTRNPLIRWRRNRWERDWERKVLASVKLAAGVQCNGTPTYEAYKDHAHDILLYFDSRTRTQDLIDDASLEQRLRSLDDNKPLRLAFSGRLIPMKGALDIIEVARTLTERGVPFTFDVFGDGVSVPDMKTAISRHGLQEMVNMHGAVDFHSELVPHIKTETDLFVCCHRQGDPSCTYIETMACGVPIVGFDNDAMRGLVERSAFGWTVPMGDIDGVAGKIEALHRDRTQLVSASHVAREFASTHTFEHTFRLRLEHLARLAR